MALQNDILFTDIRQQNRQQKENIDRPCRVVGSGVKLGKFLQHFHYQLAIVQPAESSEKELTQSMNCSSCDASFPIGKKSPLQMYNHLTECSPGFTTDHQDQFCIFCDRRVADMEDHLRRFANVHLARVMALAPFACHPSRPSGKQPSLEEMDKSVVTLTSGAFCCQACGCRHTPDLRYGH